MPVTTSYVSISNASLPLTSSCIGVDCNFLRGVGSSSLRREFEMIHLFNGTTMLSCHESVFLQIRFCSCEYWLLVFINKEKIVAIKITLSRLIWSRQYICRDSYRSVTDNLTGFIYCVAADYNLLKPYEHPHTSRNAVN